MAVMPKGERAVLVHFGDASPGDDSQSFMCEAVSACRALRIRPSRSMPGGIVLAPGLFCQPFFKGSFVLDAASLLRHSLLH